MSLVSYALLKSTLLRLCYLLTFFLCSIVHALRVFANHSCHLLSPSAASSRARLHALILRSHYILRKSCTPLPISLTVNRRRVFHQAEFLMKAFTPCPPPALIMLSILSPFPSSPLRYVLLAIYAVLYTCLTSLFRPLIDIMSISSATYVVLPPPSPSKRSF